MGEPQSAPSRTHRWRKWRRIISDLRSFLGASCLSKVFVPTVELTWRIYESPPNDPCFRATFLQTADLRPSQATRKAVLARSGPRTVADQDARKTGTGIREPRSNATFGVQLLAEPGPAKVPMR